MTMKIFFKFLKLGFFSIVFIALLWTVLANYSVIFSKTVQGEITGVERIELPVALMTSRNADMATKIFSFAIGIRDEASGIIYTASSEDRQWAVAERGQCAEAVFLPYPPWNLTKKDTYYGARLVKLYECPPK